MVAPTVAGKRIAPPVTARAQEEPLERWLLHCDRAVLPPVLPPRAPLLAAIAHLRAIACLGGTLAVWGAIALGWRSRWPLRLALRLLLRSLQGPAALWRDLRALQPPLAQLPWERLRARRESLAELLRLQHWAGRYWLLQRCIAIASEGVPDRTWQIAAALEALEQRQTYLLWYLEPLQQRFQPRLVLLQRLWGWLSGAAAAREARCLEQILTDAIDNFAACTAAPSPLEVQYLLADLRDRWQRNPDRLQPARLRCLYKTWYLLDWLARRDGLSELSPRQLPAARSPAPTVADWQRLLETRLAAFRTRPSLEGYQQIQALASPQQWAALRSELLAALPPGAVAVRLAILLHEGWWDEAIALVDSLDPSASDLRQQVTQAVLPERPGWVLAIAQQQAEAIVARGKVKAYPEAVVWLDYVRQAYQRLDRPGAWQHYRAQFLAAHARKSKLQPLLAQLPEE